MLMNQTEINEVLASWEAKCVMSSPRTIRVTKTIPLAIQLTIDGVGYSFETKLGLAADVSTRGLGKLGLIQQLQAKYSLAAQAKVGEEISRAFQQLLDRYQGYLSGKELEPLILAIRNACYEGLHIEAHRIASHDTQWFPDNVLYALSLMNQLLASALIQIGDYAHSFALARTLGRRLHAKLGPTNSGKTWAALTALAEAPSGVYLAPLRLLALEIRDRLMEAGVPCNLLTGEEQEFVPGARHTACTIEMMSSTDQVAVAVIDEIQLLQDPQRGWAWTAAVMGVPASDVYICGSACVLPVLTALTAHLGETLSVELLQRKGPLEVERWRSRSKKSTKALEVQELELQEGDAVIAFSRKDVLTLSARYRMQGFTVATIYGALAPEIRRLEANKFASGQAQILVATDAIGMGLNLPIRRILFSSIRKYDGKVFDYLQATDLQQIAGRAGRYGVHEKGLVSTLDPADLEFVAKTLKQKLADFDGPVSISPNDWHVSALASVLGTHRIYDVLSFFEKHVRPEGLFKVGSLANSLALAALVDEASYGLGQGLPIKTRFLLTNAPVDALNAADVAYYKTCLAAINAELKLDAPRCPGWLKNQIPGMLEQAEKLHKELSLYAWLSFKFPKVFHQAGILPEIRHPLAAYIESELLTQRGFELTTKERWGEGESHAEQTQQRRKKS